VKEGNLLEIHELLLNLNQLKIDDSLLQVGYTKRYKEFITFSEGSKITTNRSIFVSKEVNNDPAFMILLGFNKLGITYERKIEDLLTLAGLAGGFI